MYCGPRQPFDRAFAARESGARSYIARAIYHQQT